MKLQEQTNRIKQIMGLINEDVKSNDTKPEQGFFEKVLSSIGKFIQGEELYEFLQKIKSVISFDDFSLKYSKGTEGANQFIIEIIDNEENEQVGKFVAFIYKDKETNKHSLQIQKVEIYPKYKGRGIMRKFYQRSSTKEKTKVFVSTGPSCKSSKDAALLPTFSN